MSFGRNSNPLNRIIGLSVVLSMGFLLVVLAAVYGNWFPIVDGVIFAVAHIPSAVTKALVSLDYDFSLESSSTNVVAEVGQFLLAFLVVTGFYLPVLLHHLLILTRTAMVLTIIGGSLIYGTVYTFSLYFDEAEELEDVI